MPVGQTRRLAVSETRAYVLLAGWVLVVSTAAALLLLGAGGAL